MRPLTEALSTCHPVYRIPEDMCNQNITKTPPADLIRVCICNSKEALE